MSWFHKHWRPEDLTPLAHRQDVSMVMKAAATLSGVQQWNMSYKYGACAMLIAVKDAATLDKFVFGQYAPIYGEHQPYEERIIMNVEEAKRKLVEIGADGISWDDAAHFLVILHLRSHNRITYIKMPKDWRIMFGTAELRDSILSTFGANENPLECRVAK